MQEAIDFKDECDAVAEILDALSDTDFETVTLFKAWTIEDIIAHLHMWNHAAALTLDSREKFQAFLAEIFAGMGDGKSHPEVQRDWIDRNLNGIRGSALFNEWRQLYPEISRRYAEADPETRVAWAGPDMSVQSKIIARQMETWSHSQAIFDVLGLDRTETDRIRNIAHLGVTTYSWAFRNRGETPPTPKPYVELLAPSGATWSWNEKQNNNSIRGDAVAFCQVVTQTRNVGDTDLVPTGSTAKRWMSIAQCFAGPPNPPPEIGARHKRS